MMKSKVFLLVLAILVIIPVTAVQAETDELGYEYTPKKASEIDFSDGDIYVVPLSGDATSEDAIYAVYEGSEVEKYEKTLPTLFAALPTKFSQYYSSSKWITRSGVVSLSLQPKKPAYDEPPGMAGAHLLKYRWKVVYDKHKNSSKWKNTASMKAQLNCHADYPKKFKTPWNIEPHRTETNYHKVVAKGCNP
ncbi:hypothetical protein BN988_01588 [Oceanobacillus picturae]|uniref:DUF2599 domain-containing protein n=2 Tax=Oceanobacillus picturae TaxID=171693 RepID=W9AC94_9BACI|nr:hypothetical protein BN988_01588 [Oceanobacillus picturae]